MFDVIFRGRAVGASCVTPVVLGDKLLLATCGWQSWLASGDPCQPVPRVGKSPLEFDVAWCVWIVDARLYRVANG